MVKAILEIEARLIDESINRAKILSYFWAILNCVYGFSSYPLIHKFSNDVSIFDNFIQRFLLNAVPFLCSALYLAKSKTKRESKFIIWTIIFAFIIHIASWINVWPIALKGSPEILAYINGANIYVIAFSYAIISPPRSLIIHFTSIFSIIFLLPLYIIAYFGRDTVIFNLILGDTVLSVMTGVIVSQFIYNLRKQILTLESERDTKAKQFLGPIVSRAIYENDVELLMDKYSKAFVVSLDIRDSTELQKTYGIKWLDFRKDYFQTVHSIVSKHNGHIQKTIGDCHIINFGLNNENYPDLSEICDLEDELLLAEERKLKYVSEKTFQCLDSIFCEFLVSAKKFFPGINIRLGGGIDKGNIKRGVQGDSNSLLELDVNGDPVNCCSRLQEYGKSIPDYFDNSSSILVISPFAADYIENIGLFKKVVTVDKPIRNYPKMNWVLVKEYKKSETSKTLAA